MKPVPIAVTFHLRTDQSGQASPVVVHCLRYWNKECTRISLPKTLACSEHDCLHQQITIKLLRHPSRKRELLFTPSACCLRVRKLITATNWIVNSITLFQGLSRAVAEIPEFSSFWRDFQGKYEPSMPDSAKVHARATSGQGPPKLRDGILHVFCQMRFSRITDPNFSPINYHASPPLTHLHIDL